MEILEKEKIVNALKSAVKSAAPASVFREMYGGLVFETESGDPKTRIGGIYVYADHVTLELTEGAAVEDEHGLLEGKGKNRRHLKIRCVEDIQSMRVGKYLEAAHKLLAD